MWHPLAPLLFVCLVAACTAVRRVQPAELNPPHTPARVWVVQTDGSALVVDSPTLSADTISGMVSGKFQYVPLSTVSALRAREPSTSRTVELLLVIGGGVTALATYLLEEDSGNARFCGGACMQLPDGSIATCYCC